MLPVVDIYIMCDVCISVSDEVNVSLFGGHMSQNGCHLNVR